ncbi:hypothetical protein JW964_18600 [candidate division KSB1 bacterium]|nr:hypothetical protein [candidate division KSB1 bacterium]
MKSLSLVRFLIFLILIRGGLLLAADAEELVMGDKPDGSRSIPSHLIDLLDADSSLIWPDDQPILPFSTKMTCGKCHTYTKVTQGWHFNAMNPAVASGRKGHPWILVDRLTGTQLPLSHRDWPGTYKPELVGLTPFYFLQEFGRQMPGGGVGENDSSDVDDLYLRWRISGKLEINCLSCHEAEVTHDQAEYGKSTRNQSYRWAAAATAGFSRVYGSAKAMPDNFDIYHGVALDDSRSIPPHVVYDQNRFNSQKKVFFDITRKIPNERCYFCHSTKVMGEKWQTNEDVHIAAGLKCVNCHRNGLDHQIIRGYEGEDAPVTTLTCRGCHLGDESLEIPERGHFAAPKPKHTGFPTIHFEKLSCTACHSGPWPTEKAQLVQTSQGHGLGTHGIVRADTVMPYIQAPVYALAEDGTVAPHKMLWPAFWGFMKGDTLNPVNPKIVQQIVLSVIAKDTLTDSVNYYLINSGKWPALKTEHLIKALDSLKVVYPEAGTPVYVSGGKVYQVSLKGQIISSKHDDAQPYLWPLAHDVRPAGQALGSKDCGDCHAFSTGFNFGKAAVHTPLTFVSAGEKTMTQLQDYGPIYLRVFALTFYFRPFLKLFILFSFFILVAVLVLYLFKGLDAILKAQAEAK